MRAVSVATGWSARVATSPTRPTTPSQGRDGDVVVSSSSRALDLPEFRGSMALDGDSKTAWVPDEPVVGQSLTAHAPAQRVNHVDVVQQAGPGFGRLDAWATRIAIRLDGVPVATASTGPGRTRISFPRTSASRLTVEVLARNVTGKPVRISEVKWGDARLHYSATRADTACVTVATVDGRDLRMHPLSPPGTLDPGDLRPCPAQQPLDLDKGSHRLRSDGTWAADTLVLRDQQGEQVVAPGPVPDLSVTQTHGSGLHVTRSRVHRTVDPGDGPEPRPCMGRPVGRPRPRSATGRRRLLDGLAAVRGRASGHRRPLRAPATKRPSGRAFGGRGRRLSALPAARPAAPTRQRAAADGRRSTDGRAKGRRRDGGRQAVAVAVVAVGGLTASVWGLAVAVVLVALVFSGRLRARGILRLALAAAALTPVMWLLENLSRLGLVTAELVSGAPWAQQVRGNSAGCDRGWCPGRGAFVAGPSTRPSCHP